MRICILGGGIVGATSALRIVQDTNGAHEITLLAEKFTPDTTSDGVAGWWEPHFDPKTPKKKVM